MGDIKNKIYIDKINKQLPDTIVKNKEDLTKGIEDVKSINVDALNNTITTLQNTINMDEKIAEVDNKLTNGELYLISPNGTKYKLTVDDNGNLSTTVVS